MYRIACDTGRGRTTYLSLTHPENKRGLPVYVPLEDKEITYFRTKQDAKQFMRRGDVLEKV